jgi:hypothetical protein
MTHYDIDYSKSPTKAYDAIEDIKEFLGRERFTRITQTLSTARNPLHWRLALAFAGVQGYPVVAWYELVHGQGTWVEPEDMP